MRFSVCGVVRAECSNCFGPRPIHCGEKFSAIDVRAPTMKNRRTAVPNAWDLFGVVLLIIVSSDAQVILRTPGNTTVFLNWPATFVCETDADLSTWKVNGILLSDLAIEIWNDLERLETNTAQGSTLDILTIPARGKYNGSSFQCLAVTIGVGSGESEIATLNIQGPLSAVADFTATYNAMSVTISWAAPFSLDVTGVDPDIWYSVFIYNVTNENNIAATLCTDCTNISETHYTFTPDHLSPCDVYNFSVITYNGAGKGQNSRNFTFKNSPLINITRTNTSITYNSISVTFQAHGKTESNFTLHGIPKRDEDYFTINDTNLQKGELLTYALPADNNYSLFFEVFTTFGSMNLSLDFTTYDVQSLSVEEERDGGGVLVRGEFMSGSQAAGCLVVLQGSPTSPDILRALLRTQSQNTVSLTFPVPPSTYTVYGYDLEENGLPNTMPAVIVESEIFISKGLESVKTSNILKNANVSQSGSTIVINCEFSEAYIKASCVLICRKYDSPLLTVIEFPKLINFPVSITVENPKNYTFALYGKDSAIGMVESPAITVKFSKQSPDKMEKVDDGIDTQVEIVASSIGALLLCTLCCLSLLVLVMIVRHRHKSGKNRNNEGTTYYVRNAEYDEVALPPCSSAIIQTEPNSAYATTSAC